MFKLLRRVTRMLFATLRRSLIVRKRQRKKWWLIGLTWAPKGMSSNLYSSNALKKSEKKSWRDAWKTRSTTERSSNSLTRAPKKPKSLKRVFSDWLSWPRTVWRFQTSQPRIRATFSTFSWTTSELCSRSTKLCSLTEQHQLSPSKCNSPWTWTWIWWRIPSQTI